MKKITLKKRFIAILLAILTAFCMFIGATVSANAQTIDRTDTIGILTASDGAKAEDGKLTFRFWVDKQRLAEYTQAVELSHTYYNVIIDGNVVDELGTSAQGLNFNEWEYNLTNDANAGYGYVDVVVDVADKLKSTVAVVFGFTYYGQTTVDVWSDDVTYMSAYNSPSLSDLQLQIEFLEKELAEQTAESVTNAEAYRKAQVELERLTTEYNALKSQEETRAIGLIVATSIAVLIILITSIVAIVKTIQSDLHGAIKVIIIVLILGALGAIGYFAGPQVYNAIAGAIGGLK